METASVNHLDRFPVWLYTLACPITQKSTALVITVGWE